MKDGGFMLNKCGNTDQIMLLVEQIKDIIFCGENDNLAKETFKQCISDKKEDVDFFFDSLKDVKEKLSKDLEFFLECDPACDSKDEVIFCYPGFKAIFYYRIAHLLVLINQRVKARILSEHAHFLTGIDIHPASQIGCPFFIDHGTGIVIGETAIVGKNVRLYQGVTLGALSLSNGSKMKGIKRHPTIGDNVIIYANASVLGGNVTIGNNVVIGGNVHLSQSIEDNHKVINTKPELILIKKG